MDLTKPVFIKTIHWWPIRMAKKFLSSKRSTVIISRSLIKNKINLLLGEEATPEVFKKGQIQFYWGMDLNLEEAKDVLNKLKLEIDHIEAFRSN